MVAARPKSSLDERIKALPGVHQVQSRWKHKTAYVVAGREFAHFHRSDEIDVRITKALLRKNRNKIKKDPRVKLRPRPSDWIAIGVRSERDVEFTFGIVQQAWQANGGRVDSRVSNESSER